MIIQPIPSVAQTISAASMVIQELDKATWAPEKMEGIAAGTTIWTKASEVMKDVYTQVLGISTIAAVVTAAVALLMMNFSRSGRTVDESRAWLKRIIVTWIILNSLGFIMSYVTPFFSGGQYTP